jgi:Domain of unknown function (DUF4252)
MKTVLRHSLRLALAALAVACAAGAAGAQQPAPSADVARVKLQMEALDRLAARAEKSVDVTVDENLLGLVVGMFSNSKDPKAREIQAALAGLKGVYVRVYEFANDGQWGETDIADIRRQVGEPGWLRVVNVASRKDGQKVEVFLRAQTGKIGGLLVLATQPRELMVINMVGDVDVQKLASLQGQLGIPELDIFQTKEDEDERDSKPAAATKPAAKKP